MALVKEYNVMRLDSLFFRTQFLLIVVLALISTLAILNNEKLEALAPTLAIFITPCLFIYLKRFRDNVFSILTLFWLLLYIYIPLTFCSVSGDEYFFGPGLNIDTPYSQAQYHEAYISNLIFLLICIASAFLGLSLTNARPISLATHQKLMSMGYVPIILLTLITFASHFNDILTYLASKAEGESRGEGIFKFFFFDHALLILAGSVLLSLYGKSNQEKILQSKISLITALLFFSITLLAGSKAGWIAIVLLFFLIPYSYLRTANDESIIFLSIPAIMFVIIASPFLYFFAVFYRISLTSSLDFSLLASLTYIDLQSLGFLVNEIFTRLSVGGFDRFMLISTTFLPLESSSYVLQEFLPYLLKNMMNLLLPGTPYPEAYAPSSQLFPEVINLTPLNGEFTEAYMLMAMNSQPYTIFGVMTIGFGHLAPFAIFAYHFLISLCLSCGRVLLSG